MTAQKKPVWGHVGRILQQRRAPLGMHGTRVWNAREVKRFGSKEIYFYEIPAGSSAKKISLDSLARRLLNSVHANVDYWAKKHVTSTPAFLEHTQADDLPSIVLVRKPMDSLRDNQWYPHEGKKQTFVPYSGEIEPKDIRAVLSISMAEFQRAKNRLDMRQPTSKLREQLVQELAKILQKKIVLFFKQNH